MTGTFVFRVGRSLQGGDLHWGPWTWEWHSAWAHLIVNLFCYHSTSSPSTCPCRCTERGFPCFFSYSCCGWTVVHLLVATSTKNLPDSPIISHSLAHPLPSDLNFVTQYEVKTKTFSSYEYGGVVGFVVCNIYSHHDSAPLSFRTHFFA